MAAPAYTDVAKILAANCVPTSYNTENVLSRGQSTNTIDAVNARAKEFTRKERIKLKVGCWNVAALAEVENHLQDWFVEGGGLSFQLQSISLSQTESENGPSKSDDEVRADETQNDATLVESNVSLPGQDQIGLYVLGLQEVVDISSAMEAFMPVSDPSTSRKWKQACERGLPTGYTLQAEQQLVGMLILIYASAQIAPSISDVSAVNVGTGLLGYVGNKGAVGVRLVIGGLTRLLFVNSHLTAGSEKGSIARRNWDVSQILLRSKFGKAHAPLRQVDGDHESIGDEDFAFWFGDLNYRLDGIPGQDVRRLLTLYNEGQYGGDQENGEGRVIIESKDNSNTLPGPAQTSSSQDRSPQPKEGSHMLKYDDRNRDDPASLQSILASLLPHDQLRAQMCSGEAFSDGWREGPLTFLPTYKYDVGTVNTLDSSDKKRDPSWCDRILYRTRNDNHGTLSHKVETNASITGEGVALRGRVEEVPAETLLFEYDPATDGLSDSGTTSDTQEEMSHGLELEHYTSHQDITASDHKPLSAVFSLNIDSIDITRKAKVQQEIARQMDQAENEGRPVVTIVQDAHRDSSRIIGADGFSGSLDFGSLCYLQRTSQTLTVANTGACAATIGFIDTADGSKAVAPAWLEIDFDRMSDNQNPNKRALRQYTLEPGDTASISLTACISELEMVRQLNKGGRLNDILILRVANGRDFFIPVHGTWLCSVFGCSIDELICEPIGGIRKVRIETISTDFAKPKWSAPRELFDLVCAIGKLTESAMNEYEMKFEENDLPWLRRHDWPFAGSVCPLGELQDCKRAVREAMDCNTPVLDAFEAGTAAGARLEAMAATLIDFLASLFDGVVSVPLWLKLEEVKAWDTNVENPRSSNLNKEGRTLEILASSPAHSVVFTFLTFMLASLAKDIATATKDHSNKRMLVIDAYVDIFLRPIFRVSPEIKGKARKTAEDRQRQVLKAHLINTR